MTGGLVLHSSPSTLKTANESVKSKIYGDMMSVVLGDRIHFWQDIGKYYDKGRIWNYGE